MLYCLHIVPPVLYRLQVEIVARRVRVWVDEDTVDESAVRDGELVIRAGMVLLPNNCFMTILYSSYLIEVQGSYQSGYTQLQVSVSRGVRYVSCASQECSHAFVVMPGCCGSGLVQGQAKVRSRT